MTKRYELHPICKSFGRLSGVPYQEMLADVLANGIIEPAKLWNGLIVDGANRQEAAIEAGVDLPVVELRHPDGRLMTELEACMVAISANAFRRHETPDQKAISANLCTEIIEPLRAAARERQREGWKKRGKGKGDDLVTEMSQDGDGDESDEPSGRVRTQIAKMRGVSEGKISEGKRLLEADRDSALKVLAGEKTITEAKAEAKRNGLLEAAKPKAPKEHGTGAQTILIHKAWDTGGNDWKWAEEIGGLPLGEQAADNCHLYLVCGDGDSIVRATALADRWGGEHGFKIKDTLTMKKQNAKVGSHFRDSTDTVLFLVRGKLDLLKPGVEPFLEDHRLHKQIQTLSPGPYLEIFSPTEHAGWQRPGGGS